MTNDEGNPKHKVRHSSFELRHFSRVFLLRKGVRMVRLFFCVLLVGLLCSGPASAGVTVDVNIGGKAAPAPPPAPPAIMVPPGVIVEPGIEIVPAPPPLAVGVGVVGHGHAVIQERERHCRRHHRRH
jgi:hypothetical protein